MQLLQLPAAAQSPPGCTPLMSGSEGRPDQYELVLECGAGSRDPARRRETHDQVLFDLAHEVRYLPESTWYGGEDLGSAPRTLVLRCGGASGNGFRGSHAENGENPVHHAEPRYRQPIVMDIRGFAWIPSGSGLQRKDLGVFSERGLKIGVLRLAAGAGTVLAGRGAPRVLYALSGAGRVNGKPWSAGAALGLAAAEAVTLRADADAEWFFVRMQRFDA